MKNVKKIMCGGLAFTDKEDMEMLHRYAREGWIFKEFKGMSYYLYKEEPKDIIFDYDILSLSEEEKVEYIEICQKQGWHRIPSSKMNDEIYFFWAKYGTTPIHSDREIEASRFGATLKSAVIMLVFSACMIGLVIGSRNFLPNWIQVTAIIVFAGAIGWAGMLLAGTVFRVKRKRLRLYIRFKPALSISIVSLIVYVVNFYFNYSLIISMISMASTMFFGICAIGQYRLFRDNKEV